MTMLVINNNYYTANNYSNSSVTYTTETANTSPDDDSILVGALRVNLSTSAHSAVDQLTAPPGSLREQMLGAAKWPTTTTERRVAALRWSLHVHFLPFDLLIGAAAYPKAPK